MFECTSASRSARAGKRYCSEPSEPPCPSPPNPCLPFPRPFPCSLASRPPTPACPFPAPQPCGLQGREPYHSDAAAPQDAHPQCGAALLPAGAAALRWDGLSCLLSTLCMPRVLRSCCASSADPSLQDPWRASHCRRQPVAVPQAARAAAPSAAAPAGVRCRLAGPDVHIRCRPRHTTHTPHPTSKIRAPSCRRRHSFLFFLPAHPGMDGGPVC